MSATVTETTCTGCGATFAALGHLCPLCGTDARHAVVLTALNEASMRWMTLEDTATLILSALYAMGDDDA